MPVVYIPDNFETEGKRNDPLYTLAKGVLDNYKQERKAKRKKERVKKPMVSLGTMTGMIMLWSIPVTLGQIWLLDKVKDILQNGFPH